MEKKSTIAKNAKNSSAKKKTSKLNFDKQIISRLDRLEVMLISLNENLEKLVEMKEMEMFSDDCDNDDDDDEEEF